MATKKELELIFQQLDFDINLSSFDDRIKLQKIVYLTQEAFGVDLGFDFDWYLYGPYSSELTRVMFEKEPGSLSKIKDDSNKKKKLQNAITFFINFKSRNEFELLGSLYYVLKLAQGKMSTEKALARFVELKPQFTKKEIVENSKILKPLL